MLNLYSIEGNATPSCMKSHVRYSFFVPESLEQLHVKFAYSPKEMTDELVARQLFEKYMVTHKEDIPKEENTHLYMPLLNHLTISIDDPEKFRGATHRHDSELNLFIDSYKASPGLISGNIKSGLWSVTVSMHAILSDSCKYTIEVYGEERKDV